MFNALWTDFPFVSCPWHFKQLTPAAIAGERRTADSTINTPRKINVIAGPFFIGRFSFAEYPADKALFQKNGIQ
jgi:hypothetical protein